VYTKFYIPAKPITKYKKKKKKMKKKSFSLRLTLCSDQGFTVNRVEDPQHIIPTGVLFCVCCSVSARYNTMQYSNGTVRACDRLTRNLCNTILASSILTVFYFLFFMDTLPLGWGWGQQQQEKKGGFYFNDF
jgi:hypothetical protein